MSMRLLSRLLFKKEAKTIFYHNVCCFHKAQHVFTNVLHNSKKNTVFKYQHLQIRFHVNAVPLKDVEDFRSENNITIIGKDVPSPILDIEESIFPDYITDYLKSKNFKVPTSIQSQGWPIVLKGKNLVGIAQTGTGKTLAYLLPAIVHIKEKQAKKGRGPIVLIVAPTRELTRQIYEVARDFQKLNVRIACIYGGASRLPQGEILESGVDIVIATPGRLIDFLTTKTTNLGRCNYVVLDEADRMLDMGFEPQIRQIMESIPLERQILMWSATWPQEVQSLAKDYLGEYVQVNVGSVDLSANHNIKQHIHVCDQQNKMDILKSIMHNISGDNDTKILIFTNTKKFVDTLAIVLQRNGWQTVGIHGDKTQMKRDNAIYRFKTGKAKILVATDVAARGLDVDGITHVINYDYPNTSEDYIHRIGRTGRRDQKGISHTFITSENDRQVKELIGVLKEANQEIPQELEDLAKSYRYSKESVRTFKPKKPWHVKPRWTPRNIY